MTYQALRTMECMSGNNYTFMGVGNNFRMPSVQGHIEKWRKENIESSPFSATGFPDDFDTGHAIREQTQLNKVDNVRWADATEDRQDDDEVPVQMVDEARTGWVNKQSQIEHTLKWLEENYERADGVCLPRCVLYTHYLDLCKTNGYSPVGAANFGKIIRQRFPKLTTRRLGTRGQSKYHYYGIGIKETSIYYHSVYRGKGLTRFSGTTVKTEGSNRKYSLSSKTGTLLPDFPKASDLILDDSLEMDKVETFIMMYRTHCQRILDTVISANFDQVQNFLLHFWQGMPEHLLELLHHIIITELVGLCDSILYKVLIDVLVPSTVQDLPESLTADIKTFVRRMPNWLNNSLEDAPEDLRQKKLKAVRHFTQCVKRQLTFVHLAQTARTVLQCPETVNQMVEDLDIVEFDRVCVQVGFAEPQILRESPKSMKEYFNDFRALLTKQASIEGFTEWLENLVDMCVIQPSTCGKKNFQERAASFLLHWSIISSLLMRDLTLHSAKSFGSLHLLHMMLNEYVFLVMETQQDSVRDKEQQREASRFIRNAEISLQAKVRSNPYHKPPSPRMKRKRSTCEGESEKVSADKRPYKSDPELLPHQNPGRHHLAASGRMTVTLTRPAAAIAPRVQPNLTDQPTCRAPDLPLHLQRSPLKYVSSLNSGSNCHDNYISSLQAGLAGYPPDLGLMASGTPLTSITCNPRIANFNDSQLHQNGFPQVQLSGNGINMAAACGHPTPTSYLTDQNRSHHSFTECYAGVPGYNKYGTSYDGYGRESSFPGGSYQDAFGSCRSAFDHARGFYSPGCDNMAGTLSGSTFGVTPYGSSMSYMDIAPSGGQYVRQDTGLHPNLQQAQEFGLYGGSHTTALPTLNKRFVTPYR